MTRESELADFCSVNSGLHYSEVRFLIESMDWSEYYPEVDRDGKLTGSLIHAESDGYEICDVGSPEESLNIRDTASDAVVKSIDIDTKSEWHFGKKTGKHRLVDIEQLVEDGFIDFSSLFSEAQNEAGVPASLEEIGTYLEIDENDGKEICVALHLYTLTAYGMTVFYWGETTDFDDCYGDCSSFMFDRDEVVDDGRKWIEQKKAEYETTKSK